MKKLEHSAERPMVQVHCSVNQSVADIHISKAGIAVAVQPNLMDWDEMSDTVKGAVKVDYWDYIVDGLCLPLVFL